MKVGTELRNRRKKKNLTRDQLGRKLGISGGYVGHLERDVNAYLSDPVRSRIQKHLGLRITQKDQERINERARKWFAKYRKQTV